MNAYYDRAFNLLRSDAVRRSFDINQETAATRERYGRNIHGQSALLARRLVEGGVRFVSVYDKVHNGLDNWDTHVNNFGRLKDQLLPPCDMAFSALVEDLESARPVGLDAGHHAGRIRPHAEDQRSRRPRSLARLL